MLNPYLISQDLRTICSLIDAHGEENQVIYESLAYVAKVVQVLLKYQISMF